MERYNKLIGALVGNLVGIILIYLSVKIPGIAQCTAAPDGTQACTVLGMSQTAVNTALLALLNSFFVWRAKPNAP